MMSSTASAGVSRRAEARALGPVVGGRDAEAGGFQVHAHEIEHVLFVVGDEDAIAHFFPRTLPPVCHEHAACALHCGEERGSEPLRQEMSSKRDFAFVKSPQARVRTYPEPAMPENPLRVAWLAQEPTKQNQHMTKASKTLALAALAAGGIAVAPASAQNPNFTPGDLLMGFQLRSGTGSDKTVLVNLGDTASLFRDGAGYRLSIVNIGALLDGTFGIGAGNSLNWYENPNLYFGLAGTWDNASPSDSLQNGDPNRTLYISKSRTAVGTEGVKNSTIANVSSDTSMSTGANNIYALQQVIETGYVGGSVAIPTTTANTWEDYNPFTGSNQSTAFGAFAGRHSASLCGRVLMEPSPAPSARSKEHWTSTATRP